MAGKPDAAAVSSELETLVATYQKVIRDAVVQVCPRDLGLQVDEIEQDVRIRLWRALQSETDIRDRASYIYKVALTATIDAIRRVKARREEPFDPSGVEKDAVIEPIAPPVDAPDRLLERRRLFTKVSAALARLAPDRRRAAALHLEGLTRAEIASLLDWTETRTRNLVHRGLTDLRKLLRAEGIDVDSTS
jgi:RNA polymerase sigma-70 factor (ECF subfamily)